ncbi:hypothetical protein DMJ13_00475 [halophilic archaeon]|nr:hypothetical protein DMJ13_00475 [halophilic archaeon]
MECPECGDEALPFVVPPELREHVPSSPESVAICPTCLSLEPSENGGTELTDFSTVSDALPDDRETAAAMVLATALMSSLARNRRHIEALFDHVEATGVDPLLVLDRLADDPDLRPPFNIDRRREQLLQLRD